MNLPIRSLSSSFVFALALGFLQIVSASGDMNSDLETLRKKIAAKEAGQQGPSQGGRQLSFQLKQLQGLIARADYDRVEQMLGNLGEYGLTPDLQDEWAQVFELLGKEIKKLQAASMEKWRGEVDQLVADVKKRCLEANSSADLDVLFVRCAALQMRREQQNNVLGERTTRKLMGAASTLSAWTNYLDFRDSGNAKRANEALRSLRTNDSQYPLLTVQEIEGRIIRDDVESLPAREVFAKIFIGTKSPDDLPAAMELLKAYTSSPSNPEIGNLRNAQSRMLIIQQAWESANKEDDEAALKTLGRLASSGGYEDAQIYEEPLKKQVSNRILQKKASTWTKLAQDSNEDAGAYLGRILEELKGKGDYVTMIEVMKFADQISRTPQAENYAKDRAAIDQFLAAQRFENAGDVLAAVTNYRLVVGTPRGKYAPIAQSEEALKKLRESNPEVFKSYEGVIMEELRGLRQQMQMLLARTTGGRPPYPPY